MNKDMHFDMIYVLCCTSGFSDADAELVAHASQYVDDCNHKAIVMFPSGNIYKPIVTFSTVDSVVDQYEALEYLLPFHFCPPHISSCISSFITKPFILNDGSLLDSYLHKILNNNRSENQLYQLGIILHTIADTYSHQDFIALKCSHNNVRICGKGIIKYILKRVIRKIIPIGHASVIDNPDLPYKRWSYKRGEEIVIRDNREIYFEAIVMLLKVLTEFLIKNPSYRKHTPVSADKILWFSRELLLNFYTNKMDVKYWVNKDMFKTLGVSKIPEYDIYAWYPKHKFTWKNFITNLLYKEDIIKQTILPVEFQLFCKAAYMQQRFILSKLYTRVI